jgi:transitional endoplasmic reticulum ATPase
LDRDTSGDRDAALDAILNVVDGIGSKGKEIMVVVTSNSVESINRAMLRPGRLDAIITIRPPDAEAAERLMRLYGRGLIATDESLTEAGIALAGQIPAVIREAVERAKLYAISRHQSMELHDEDLVRAANGMKHHLDLLRGKLPDTETPEHKLGAAMMAVLQKGIGQSNGSAIYDVADATKRHIEAVMDHIGVAH